MALTYIRAPYPNHKVTMILPNPQLEDSRASESTITIKRTMTGRVITYVNPSERVSMSLPFRLTRMKALELEAFVKSYQSARWHVTLGYDGSEWDAQLIGQPISRTAVERIGNNATVGKELVDVTLTLSAKRLNP